VAYANDLMIAAGTIFQGAQATPSTSTPTTPTLPIGWLVMWWICSRNKTKPIGGWLAYYYYQLYFGLIISCFLIAGVSIHSYVPENFPGMQRTFYLFLASSLPSLLLMLFQGAVATFLLAIRTWDLVELLRKVLVLQAIAEGIGLGIDAKYFPDDFALGLLSFVPTVLWTFYFFKSERVRRVFKTHDWSLTMAPPPLTS
jgi:hypothetical protein